MFGFSEIYLQLYKVSYIFIEVDRLVIESLKTTEPWIFNHNNFYKYIKWKSLHYIHIVDFFGRIDISEQYGPCKAGGCPASIASCIFSHWELEINKSKNKSDN
jgi:hypothetical protein